MTAPEPRPDVHNCGNGGDSILRGTRVPLLDAGPRPAVEVFAAARALGIRPADLNAAARRGRVVRLRDQSGVWYWMRGRHAPAFRSNHGVSAA
jgi:hypothetical protein